MTSSLLRSCLFLAGLASAVSLHAEGPFRNRDNKNANDPAEGTYPIPYQLPTETEIKEALVRVRDFMHAAVPMRVIDRATNQEVTVGSAPVATVALARSEANFSLIAYEMGVVHAGMLKAAEVTGDPRFSEFTRERLQFLAEWLPYFRAQEEAFHLERRNSLAGALDPRSLDDSGSMCAALIRARLAKVGPDLKSQIDTWSEWVGKKQFRLSDGTLARQRPQAVSLWADDLYMSVPALAEMGRMTGDRAWFDLAVQQVVGQADRLFNARLNIFTHGWNEGNPDAPQFYWGRANGWAVLAMCDLLDVLPKEHPGYARVLTQLRATLRGLAQFQSGMGLWHQMLDRNDSYLETSASAMFVYGYAHAINQGWISPITYGSIAQAGWCGLATKINAKGQVEGTCVGTTFASDQVYYYNRPASVYALHGYGPVLLAGAEMIKLLKNPAIDVQVKLRTYHYVPKGNGETSYREHQ